MLTRLTTPYRARLANVLTGQSTVAGLAPTRAAVGNGASGRPPTDAMYGAPTDATLGLTRSATHEVRATVTVPAGQATAEYDEVGIYADDGTLLLHATFTRQALSSGAEAVFEFTFNPEVYDG